MKYFIDRNKIVVCALCIFICFHRWFEEVITTYLMNPFFSRFEDEWGARIVLIFLIGVIFYRFWNLISRKKFETTTQIFFSVIFFTIWFYYRFCNHQWCFTSLFGTEIKYVDIIPLWSVLSLISVFYYCKSLFYNNKKQEISSYDKPILKDGNDELGRLPLAKVLAENLVNCSSHTVGITATWGYGKTSFLNLIKNQFRKRDDIVIVDFIPWQYGKSKDLTQAFYSEFSAELSKYNKAFSRDIRKYARILSSFDNGYARVISSISEQFLEPTNATVDHLNNLIKDLNKKIFVFVDDIDRLGSEEIEEVIKLIRDCERFINTNFILAYDRDYVIDSIKNLNKEKASTFLDKIIQQEIPLPPIDEEDFRKCFFQKIQKIVNPEDFETIRKEFIPVGLISLKEHFQSFRDIVRLCISFEQSYKKLEGNIVVVDLLFIEILKLKYNSVYTYISNNLDTVLVDDGRPGGTLYLYSEEKYKESIVFNYDLRHHKDIKVFFGNEENLRRYNLTQQEFDNAMRIVSKLFPEYSFHSNFYGINKKMSIQRYFYVSLLEKDIDNKEFETYWKEDYKTLKSKIKEWSVIQSYSLARQLQEKSRKNDVASQKKVFQCMLYLGSVSSNGKNTYDELDNILKKLTNLGEHGIKEFVISSIKDVGRNEYVFEYLNYHLISYDWDLDIVPFKSSQLDFYNLVFDMFNDAIQENVSISTINSYMIFFRMYDSKREGKNIDDYSTLAPNLEANKLFIEYSKRNINQIIRRFIQIDHTLNGNNQRTYTMSKFARDVWGSWQNFEKFLQKLERTEMLNEFIDFVKVYIKANEGLNENSVEKTVEFEFKNIDLNIMEN